MNWDVVSVSSKLTLMPDRSSPAAFGGSPRFSAATRATVVVLTSWEAAAAEPVWTWSWVVKAWELKLVLRTSSVVLASYFSSTSFEAP